MGNRVPFVYLNFKVGISNMIGRVGCVDVVDRVE